MSKIVNAIVVSCKKGRNIKSVLTPQSTACQVHFRSQESPTDTCPDHSKQPDLAPWCCNCDHLLLEDTDMEFFEEDIT